MTAPVALHRSISFLLLCLTAAFLGLSAAAAENKSGGVQIADEGEKLVIKIGGQLFTEYWYKNVPRPYFYPVIGPGGTPMTGIIR